MRSLKESLLGERSIDGREQKMPVRAHFTTPSGSEFVLDTSRDSVLIRFEGQNEIYALTKVMGPKGDIILKNDIGEAVLKATRWGGYTLFTSQVPAGEAVAVIGAIEAFTPQDISPRAMLNHLGYLSYKVSKVAEQKLKTKARIIFDAQIDIQDGVKGDEYLFADAANVTTEAILLAANSKRGAEILALIKEVHFSEGRPPTVKLTQGVLAIKLDTDRGIWGGRPSSKRISQVLFQSLAVK
jgi:hypothetical protein